MEPEFYTPEELAKLVRMTVKFIRKQSFRIPGRTKIGRYVRYEKTAVLRALGNGRLLLK